MSVKNDVLFHLIPAEKGYTLTIEFPALRTQKEISFVVGKPPEKGATVDLYSQNGKVGAHALSFFENHDLKALKKVVKVPLPPHEGPMQTLFVLDLKDQNGNYGDAESIRQS
jgi:hypothetical protein